MRKFISAISKAAAGIALIASANSAQAATVLYSGSGKAIGVGNLVVGTNSYNVEFSTALTASTTPTFLSGFNAAEALAAAQALSEVLFGLAPNVINGCTSTSICNVYIPVAGTPVQGGYVLNVSPSPLDLGLVVLEDTFGYKNNISTVNFSSGQNTVAGFSAPLSPSAVPEPSTWLLMMAGFGVAGLALRRGKRADRRVAFA